MRLSSHHNAQDADLLYLSGISQPAIAILGDAETHGGLFHIVLPAANPERQRWEGPRINPDAAVALFDADDAYDMTEVVLTQVSHSLLTQVSYSFSVCSP